MITVSKIGNKFRILGTKKPGKQGSSLKRSSSRSGSTVAKQKTKQKSRGKFNINFKKEATRAGLGVMVGLPIKWGVQLLAKNNPQATELARRAANVAAAYAGHGSGELGYQTADTILTMLIEGTGGTAPGGGPGEFA